MAKLQHTFVQGKMNKDLDERLVPNGQYRDAQNVQVSTSESSDVGAVENILGNTVRNLRSTSPNAFWQTGFGLTNPVCIGVVKDSQNEKIYWFLSAPDSSTDAIVEFDQVTGIVAPILVDVDGVLNFNKLNLITGINILEGELFWTDNLNEPRVITISRFKAGSTDFTAQTHVYGSNDPSTRDFIASDITVIRKSPKKKLQVSVLSTLTAAGNSHRGAGIRPVQIQPFNFNTGLVNRFPKSGEVAITWGESQRITPLSAFENKEVVFSAFVVEAEGYEREFKVFGVLKTGSFIGSGEVANNFIGATLTITANPRDVPNEELNWEMVLVENDYIYKNDFPRFSYRWKYYNGNYSTFAPFSDAAFLPNRFKYNATLGENIGMTNHFRKGTLTFPTDVVFGPGADVQYIEVLYKSASTNNIVVIETHDRSSVNLATFEITEELTGLTVESNQLLRPWDNVPKKAKAQEVIGNRIVYGNYTQGYPVNQDVSIANTLDTTAFTTSQIPFGLSSLKSNRTYQVGVSFLDEFNRESPVFSNGDASLFIDQSNSANVNKINVNVTSAAPSWAIFYKYYVKEISGRYYNLALNRYYDAQDGNYWLSFPSSERNKVQTGDFLSLKKQQDTNIAVNSNAEFKILDIQNEAPASLNFKAVESAGINIGSVNNFTDTSFNNVSRHSFLGPSRINFDESINSTGKIQFVFGSLTSEIYSIVSGGISDTTVVTPIAGGQDFVKYTVALQGKLRNNDLWLTTIGANVSLLTTVFNTSDTLNPEFVGNFFIKVQDAKGVFSTDVIQPGLQNSTIAVTTGSVIVNDIPATPFIETVQYPGGNPFIRVSAELAFNDTNTGTVPNGSTPFTGQKPTNAQRTFALTCGPLLADGVSTGRSQGSSFYGQDLKVGKHIRFSKNGNEGNIYTIQGVSAVTTYTRTIAGVIYGYSRKTVTVDRDFNDQFTAGNVDNISQLIFETSPILATVDPAIFETIPKNDVDTDLYYEATNARPMSSFGNAATLSYFNCFAFGNGVESANIKDDFNSNVLSKGVRVSSTVLVPYSEEKKGSSLIFSGIFNSISGVNNANQFLIAENITKDLNPTYGTIQKLHARDTDLVALLEDKCFRILANKDALYNADGSTNVTANRNVLGQTVPFVGEYGISKNPESFASFGFRTYFTDKARGAVLRLSRDGLTDISDKGMSSFFQDGLRTNVNPSIIGSYDTVASSYNIVIGGEGVSFKEGVDGWNTKMSYNPEAGISLNNEYYTFKLADLYKHTLLNDYVSPPAAVPRSNFYGVQGNTTVTAIFNDAPTSIKNFKTLSYEGDAGWAASVVTNAQSGTVSTWKEREGIYFNYIMGDGTFFRAELNGAITSSSTIVISAPNTNISVGDTVTGAGILNVVRVTNIAADKITITISSAQTLANGTKLTFTNVADVDTKEFSVQGIGKVLAPTTGSTIEINGDINVSLQSNDVIYHAVSSTELRTIGTVLAVDRINNHIRLDANVPGAPLVANNFVLFAKNSQVNTSGLLGYQATVKMTTNSGTKKELFAVNSEVFISSE